MAARYALYFAPGGAWGRFGEDWLARGGELTAAPRRYGFHATLKAPFRFAEGISLFLLVEELKAFCNTQTPFAFGPLVPQRVDDFLALVPPRPDARLDAIAAQCVMRFHRFAAPLNADELKKRNQAPLDAREQELLAHWGYPYVLDRFRFHMSLTGPLPEGVTVSVPVLPDEALVFDGIGVFEESSPGSVFFLKEKIPFRNRGRLVYVVGPSGAGKDSLLGWALPRVPRAVLAPRTDTRMVESREFEQRLERGEFVMHWRANGHAYGVANTIRASLDDGKTVVVNGSRAYLPQALTDFPYLEVVHVNAPPAALRARLASRGREGTQAIESRLAREPLLDLPAGVPVAEIVNAGALESAGAELAEYLAASH